MHVAVIIVGQSKSFLTKANNSKGFYWGPDKESAHEFDTDEEALKKGRSLLPDNIRHNVVSEPVKLVQ